jgi:hypothetical protein
MADLIETIQRLEARIEALAASNATLEARIAALEPEPTPEPAPTPQAMTPPDRPRYQMTSPSDALGQTIANMRVELAETEAKIAAWRRGEDPDFPPTAPYTPGYVATADVLRRNIADFEDRHRRMTGQARPLATRR